MLIRFLDTRLLRCKSKLGREGRQREQGTNWLSGSLPYWHLSPGVPQWPPVYEGHLRA